MYGNRHRDSSRAKRGVQSPDQVENLWPTQATYGMEKTLFPILQIFQPDLCNHRVRNSRITSSARSSTTITTTVLSEIAR